MTEVDVDLFEVVDLLAMKGWVEYDDDDDPDDLALLFVMGALHRAHPQARSAWELVEWYEADAQDAYDASRPTVACQCGAEYRVDEDGAWARGSLMFWRTDVAGGRVLRDRDPRDRCSCGRPIGYVVDPQLSLF
jgi:hypothetical protein